MSAATWYVKPGGNDASAGNSWATAYQTLTKALQSAASGDQIWVAAGTYKPTTGTDRTISFNMKTGVAILGGFPATGNPVLADRDRETNVTTLSGDIGTAGDNSDNSYHVVSNFNVGNTAVLDGFTLTAGSSNSNGGGMYCISSSPVINNCRFVSNGAAIFGAGLFCGQNSNVALNNCFFYSNHAGSVGGGISSQSSSLTISNTVFSGNSGTSGAGLCVQDAPAIVTNCVFSGNSAGNLGGGMLTWNAASSVTNCSFSGNQATSLTGGFVNYGTTSATLRNCIIWGNQGSGVANVGGGTALVTHSIVQGGYDGAGNSNINPLFVNAPGDLRLQACSPALNKGSDAAVPAGVTTDLNGNNRFFGTVDMGAYEYQSNASPLVAICKNLTVQLNATGNVSVPASAADNGSTGCGSLTFYLSQTNFNCSNVGTNNLLFVVSDNSSQSASCAVTVTVQDNTVPTAVCQNTTLQLDASGNASLSTSAINNGSADACGIASLALSKTMFNCSNIGTNSVTLSVTDNNNKTATCAATVTVQDNIAPTAVCKDATVQLDATGNVTVPASAVDNGSVDACGIASLTLSHTTFNCTNVYQAVTLTVTDNHGKTATCAAVITVQDNIAPAAICKNATVQLDATGNVTVPVSAVNNGSTDACGIAALTLSKSNFNCSNVGSLLVSLEVRDNNGNKAYCSATLTVQDNIAPTAVCQNATVQLDGSGNASLAPAALNNGSADACGIASLSLSKTAFDCSNVGANTVMLTVTDNNGKTATCSATVTVQDNAAPTAVCQNATVQLDASGNASIAASSINNGSADACGVASVSLSKTAFDCSNVGANTVMLTVTDNNGKTATCSATVTVQDNAAPTAVCQNATVQLDASGNASSAASSINNGSADACGIASVLLSKTAFDCSNVGANTVMLTVTDNNGKTATCSATVTVQDNAAPTAVCQNATIQLDAGGNAGIATSSINNGSADACGIASLSLGKTAFDCSNVGANTVTLTVTDNNGKTATCSATVTVQDNAAPTAICQNATIQLDASGNASIAASAINNGSADACGIASLSLSKTAFDCSNVGANAVTFTVTDNNGKTATCSATVTVQDNAAPTAVCQNATVQLDVSGNASIAALAINNGSADACGIASLSLSKTAFDCSNIGANAVTLTVTDNNGKTAICSATVTVQDNAAPTAVCQNATVQLDASGNASIAASSVNNGSADACGVASVLLSKTAFDCSNTGANTVTLTVTDNSGKTATCSATVTVQDNAAPTAICQNATIQLDGSGNASVAASSVNNGSADACGIASLSLSKTAFDCSNIGANAVTLTVTDNSDKTATCSATVTVQDNAAPTAICQNATIQLDGSGNANLSTSAINNGSTDACGVASMVLSKAMFDCSNTGANAVTLTVTDNSGKNATCLASVTVLDIVPPTLTCPSNIIRNNDPNLCSAVVTYQTPTTTDNCGNPIAELDSPSNTASGNAFPKGTTVVQWKASDGGNLTTTCSFSITVNDIEAPILSCPPNIIRNTDWGTCTAVVDYVSPTYSDNCPSSALSLLNGGGSGSTFPKGTTVVTWMATDASNNTRTCSFRIIVGDGQAPTFTLCPSNQVLNCGQGACSIIATYQTPTATDNCSSTTVVRTGGPISGSSFLVGTTSIAWRAFDASGRSSTCSFSITVLDNQAPQISCPQNIVQNTTFGDCNVPVFYPLPLATDNCGVNTTLLLEGLSSGSVFPIGTTVVTWRATDVSGSSATCSFSVTVNCGLSRPDPTVTRSPENTTFGDISLRISPNPANEHVLLSIEGMPQPAPTARITVFDAAGRLVSEQNWPDGQRSLSFDVSNWESGIYWVIWCSAEKSLGKRLAVTHE